MNVQDARVLAWLQDLGGLCAGAMPRPEAVAKMGAYAPLLAEAFPADAFTRASLAAVAGGLTFFPSYGEVSAQLSVWWRDNRPTRLALAAPVPASPADAWEARKREISEEWRQADVAGQVARIMDMPATDLRATLLRALRQSVAAHAPDRIELVPETTSREPAVPEVGVRQPSAPRDVSLGGEALAAARESMRVARAVRRR